MTPEPLLPDLVGCPECEKSVHARRIDDECPKCGAPLFPDFPISSLDLMCEFANELEETDRRRQDVVKALRGVFHRFGKEHGMDPNLVEKFALEAEILPEWWEGR